MRKTIFLISKVYDLSTPTANEIETDVQNWLDATSSLLTLLFGTDFDDFVPQIK